jgi:hypothetical protein
MIPPMRARSWLSVQRTDARWAVMREDAMVDELSEGASEGRKE